MKAIFDMITTHPVKAARRSPKRKHYAPCVTYRADENGNLQLVAVETRAPKRLPAVA